ncbi:FecR domain-containing protein [Pedobacter gandavensis]|uniref:FecR family protein n=1 Tax=Pedobacter TaxID=84567 RepID=UPI001C99CB2E|nr:MULTISPECIES: FecR domain-containing protein [Pedobacter]WGQ08097.1 FecR domain-containing protein [Pedobacter gandavensis]
MKNFETNESFIFSLIIEDLEETISAENKIILSQWRNADPENEKLYQEFLGVQINLDKLMERHELDAHHSWTVLDQKLDQDTSFFSEHNDQVPTLKNKNMSYFWIKVAAMFLILSTLGYGYFFWKNKDIVINTGTAMLTNVVLPDGTDLKLNAGTSISYSKNNFLADRKLVLIKGEAFVQVAANPTSRFRVELGEVEAKDIGTRFNIIRNENQSAVTVEEGQVELWEYGTVRKVNLTAGKLGIYDVVNKTLMAIDNPDPNYKAWLDKSFVFNAVPLPEVLQKLETVYQTKIEMQGQELKHRKLTAKLKYQQPDSALAVIAATLDCQLIQRNGKFVLAGK